MQDRTNRKQNRKKAGSTDGNSQASQANRSATSSATYPGPVHLAIRDRLPGGGLILILQEASTEREATFELHAQGRQWISAIDSASEKSSAKADETTWIGWWPGVGGDVAEYRLKLGKAEVVRTVAWLRARRLLVIAEDWTHGDAARGTTLQLAPGVNVVSNEDGGLHLTDNDSARMGIRIVAPISEGLIDGPGRVRVSSGSRVGWQPLFLSLDPRSTAKPPVLRPLTITEERRIVGPEVASAFRLSWPGQSESLVVYRSRAAGEKRAFLGYQSGARFLVGAFTRKGELTPIIQID